MPAAILLINMGYACCDTIDLHGFRPLQYCRIVWLMPVATQSNCMARALCDVIERMALLPTAKLVLHGLCPLRCYQAHDPIARCAIKSHGSCPLQCSQVTWPYHPLHNHVALLMPSAIVPSHMALLPTVQSSCMARACALCNIP
jgi:hypothetical protein